MFSRKPKDPILPKQFCHRIKNVAINNFRGIIAFILGFALFPKFSAGYEKEQTRSVYLLMLIYFVLQPVAPPIVGLFPVFLFPILGVLDSKSICSCYINEVIVLFILTAMLRLLWNSSGLDQRIALFFLCSGDNCQFSGKRLVYKCSSAAFFLSMFSNSLLTSEKLIGMVAPKFGVAMRGAGKKNAEPESDKMRDIVNSAINVSSVIGSLTILHSSHTVLTFKAIWIDHAPRNQEYADIFNYLQYSCFALPVCLVMFFLCVTYHMLCVNLYTDPMSAGHMTSMRNQLLNEKAKLKKINLFEKLSIFFTVIMMLFFLLRWCTWFNGGWAVFRTEPLASTIPRVKDATVAAIFVLLLSVLPREYYFFKYFKSKITEREMPPQQITSAILWWRYVDNNVQYAFILIMGAGVALNAAVRETKLNEVIATDVSPPFTNLGFCFCLLLIILGAAATAHAVPPIAAVVLLMPAVLAAGSKADMNSPWPTKMYLGALCVGMASAFNYIAPYKYTTSYYEKTTGKTKWKKLAKYGFAPIIICCLVLWVAVCYFAPVIFDPSGEGLAPVVVSAEVEGGEAAGGGGAAPEEPPPEPDI